jgi:mersacidin/lichenicidin family type 2 lantibiotic
MSDSEMIRAWKDTEYRATLSVTPAHPAGVIDLADPDFSGGDADRLATVRYKTITRPNQCTFKGGNCK